MMTPSPYELNAWRELEDSREAGFKAAAGRHLSDFASRTSSQVTAAADKAMARSPRLHSVVEAGQTKAAASGKKISHGARHLSAKARDAVPDKAFDWIGETARAAGNTAGKIGRIGLTPERIVRQHQRSGAQVTELHELRGLDLRDIDHVRGRLAGLGYSATAMLSGAGAGAIATGGTLGSVFSMGAAALPAAGAVAGTMAADMAVVFSLSSRAVGRTALAYGYDPEVPSEQLFVLSVMNLSTAGSVAAKQVAMKDLAKLTHALAVKLPWAQIEQSLLARLLKSFMGRFSQQVTKKSLGKAVPYAGIVIGAVLNGFTVDQVVRDAELAYRRRFLLEKYPHLDPEGAKEPSDVTVLDEADDAYSVIEDLERLRSEDPS